MSDKIAKLVPTTDKPETTITEMLVDAIDQLQKRKISEDNIVKILGLIAAYETAAANTVEVSYY